MFWTWARILYAAPLPLRPFPLPVDCREFHDAVVPARESRNFIVDISPTRGLNNVLSNAWTVPGPQGRLPNDLPSMGDPTGAKPKSGELLLCLVTSLVVRQVSGLEAICLLGVQENAKIVLVHILFTVSPDVYSANVQLWEVVGEIPKDGTQALLFLTGIHFYPKFSFQGVSCTNFNTHVGGLDLKTGGPNAHAQQVAVEFDKGSLKVYLAANYFFLQR